MLKPSEIVVDNFAGGGGASTGNSVCPPLAEALVRANLSEGEVVRVAA